MARVLRQHRILAVEDEPPHQKGAQEPVAVREVGPRDLVETSAAGRAVHVAFMGDCVVLTLHVVRELSNKDAVAARRRNS